MEKKKEQKNLWKRQTGNGPKKFKFFSDYLKTLEWLLESEKNCIVWTWKELLADTENHFLLCIYPEIYNEELKDIYLALASLFPLPSFKEIRDFMKKCSCFSLSSEQKEEVKSLLKPQEKDVFNKAKKYMDKFCWSSSEQEVVSIIEKMSIEAKTKEEFLAHYGELRRQLPVTQRVAKETRFLNKIRQALSEEEVKNTFLLEIWLIRFQKTIERTIVEYFAEELEEFSQEKKSDIYDALKRANSSSDITTLFLWFFSQYIFHPTLNLLDTGSLFGSKGSEEILKQLMQKFMHQDIPIKIQYSIAKTIKEKKQQTARKQKFWNLF